MARNPYPGEIYPGETYPGVSQTYVTPYGEWEYVSEPEERRAVLDAFGQTTFSALVDNPIAGSTYTLDIGGVPGYYDNEYFDGSESPDSLFTASWSGVVDDSVSTLSADTIDTIVDYAKSVGIKSYLTTDDPIRGTRSLLVIPDNPLPNPTTDSVQGTSIALKVPAGAQGAFSVTIRTQSSFVNPVVLSSSPTLSGHMDTYSGVGTKRLMVDVLQSNDPRTVYIHLPGGYQGGAVVIDELNFVIGPFIGRYFDGSMSDDADISYSWEGVPDNSRSLYEISRTIEDATGVSPLALQSLLWKHHGNYSMRILPGGGIVIFVFDNSVLLPGQTYTISVVRRMTEDTETVVDQDVMYTANLVVTGVGGTYSSNVPARTGTDLLSVSFTMPEDPANAFIAFYGAVDTNVWFDAFIVTDGTGDTEYFDGNSVGAEWLGIPQESTSRMIPVTPRSGGYPLKKYISSYTDRLGEIEELVARLTYLPEDVRHEVELYGIDQSNRSVPLGATSDLVDVRTADDQWVPWIAQILGIDPRDISVDELRTAIQSGLTGMVSGTRRAIASAVRAIMTGDPESRTVRLYPHTSSLTDIGGATEWDMLIVTPVEQGLTESQVRDAIDRAGAKPAGLMIHHVSKSTTWADLHSELPTWASWNDKTWEQIETTGY